MKIIIATALIFLLGSSCVSVNLGAKGASKSGDVKFKAPPSPFQALKAESADRAWLNKDNGNSISFQSSCNDPADPPLEVVQGEILSAFENSKIVKTENKTFNGREALITEAEGVVDGVKTRTELLIFKKNNCIYSLSYVGVSSRYPQNQAHFRDFADSFEAP